MRYMVYLLAIVLVTGCSCGEKTMEKIAEKAIEAQVGENTDVEVDEDGLRIKTKDGQMSITSGKSAQLPENFPEDIPLYEGFVLDMAMELPTGYSISFTTEDDLAMVSQWYADEMINMGWTKASDMDMGNQKMMVFKMDARGVNLVVAKDNELTRIALTSVKE